MAMRMAPTHQAAALALRIDHSSRTPVMYNPMPINMETSEGTALKG